ncbi:MAG: oligosaccharide flippase family protein [Candidatus Aminicenantes bacterium]|nr:MAG: oligosaccharide flippase family protein [Candidatus Aminicenantes bacterium]
MNFENDSNNLTDSQDFFRQVKSSSAYVLSGKLILPIINILVTIYVIRILSVDDYGIYNVLLAVMGYIGLLSSFGIPLILRRFVPEFHQQNDIKSIRKLVFQGSVLRLAMVIFFVLVVLLSSEFLGKVFKVADFSSYFKIFLFAIIFSIEAKLIGAVLTALFLHKYFMITEAVYAVARAAVLFVLLQAGYGLNGLLIAEAIAFFLHLTFFLYFYNQKFRKKRKIPAEEIKKTKLPYKRLAHFGLFSYLSEGGAQILDKSTDYLVISAFLNPHQVGLYAFAGKVMDLATRWMPHSLLFNVIEPAFLTKYAEKKDKRQLDRMFGMLLKTLAFTYFPIVAGIISLGDKIIIHVFDPNYTASMTVLIIMAIFTGFNFFQLPLVLTIGTLEKVQLNFYSKIFSIYNLVLDLILVRPFGIIGIALATSSAVFFKNMFLFIMISRHVKLHIPWNSLLRFFLNAGCMGLFCLMVKKYVNNLFFLIIIIAAGALVYLLVSFLNKGFSESDREVFNKIIGKRIFIF